MKKWSCLISHMCLCLYRSWCIYFNWTYSLIALVLSNVSISQLDFFYSTVFIICFYNLFLSYNIFQFFFLSVYINLYLSVYLSIYPHSHTNKPLCALQVQLTHFEMTLIFLTNRVRITVQHLIFSRLIAVNKALFSLALKSSTSLI